MEIRIYQVYYNEHTRLKCSPLCLPYDNTWYEFKPLQPAFENHVISQIIHFNEHKPSDYFGVFSWQFESKYSKSIEKIIPQITGEFDVYSFHGKFKEKYRPTYMWRHAENWHGPNKNPNASIINAARLVLLKMGFDIDLYNLDVKDYTVYGNHFLARPEIYERYVKEFLNPALKAMEDEEISDALYVDTKYKSKLKHPVGIEKVTGVPYYPLHTFICERLFSTWLTMNNYSIKHI